MVNRRKVAVLGATGMMGQKFVQLLSHHPWFEVSAVAASDRSVGKTYASSIGSRKETDMPVELGELLLMEPKPQAAGDSDIAFSALPAEIAGHVEEEFARAGVPVFSNASSHRMDQYVPLLNPEVNPEHASMVEEQKRRVKTGGFIVANPNCTTAILTLSLKPLQDKFGLETVVVSSMQAVSGAGYPGVASLDIMQNVIPFIRNEEEKVEAETNKILGTIAEPQALQSLLVATESQPSTDTWSQSLRKRDQRPPQARSQSRCVSSRAPLSSSSFPLPTNIRSSCEKRKIILRLGSTWTRETG